METNELLETIIKEIVEKPEKVKINKKVDEMGVLLSIDLDNKDAGFIIGKQGKTIKAIKTIISVIGAKKRARISIKLNVPDKPKKEKK